MSWFDTARFGMFIHWSHSSQSGIDVSWPLVSSVPVDEYHATAATFDPQAWDAAELARRAAKLGMQYAVLTTKHHDGYAMFHTKQPSGLDAPYGIEHSPFGRDIVREYADAMRAEGIRVGFYYSLLDWHHPDYPPFTDADKPYTFGKWRQPEPEAWERYIAFMFAQVRELLTDYGQVDVIWFDGHWERTPEQWKAKELEEMIRSFQPDILINDRLPNAGDYQTPEQLVPPQPLDGPWETCMTIGKSWGYNPNETDRKSGRDLIHSICEVAGKGGNLLLNVGPMGDGALPPADTEPLDEVERWMSTNKDAIVGTESGLEPWQFYGPSTRRDSTTYLHLLMRPYESVTVRGIHVKRLRSIRALTTGDPLDYKFHLSAIDETLNLPDPVGEVVIYVPENAIDPSATVLEMRFVEEPE
jgi:alpha-L-fucosidase